MTDNAVSPIEQALIELRGAERQKDSAQALRTVTEALGKLTPEDRTRLLLNPAVDKLISDAEQRAAETMKPGSIICDAAGKVIGKVPWTAAAMKESLPMVTWTPMETLDVTVNGVSVHVIKGVPTTTPDVFRAVAEEAWLRKENHLETAREILRRNFGDNSMILHGDGTPA